MNDIQWNSLMLTPLLCFHSSDDYYEYGHSGESYDTYSEFPTLSSLIRITCILTHLCSVSV